MAETDREANRFTARASRYASVGANVGGVAARMAAARLFGGKDGAAPSNAAALAQALGGLKGPIMKVAQLLATVPDLLPPEYAAELQKLQADAPPMGAAFVKRRMMAELGADWQSRFETFDLKPAAAASLGQVHRATALDGTPLACKLQYPDMQSAVEADLKQLQVAFAFHRRMNSWLDTTEIAKEIGARVREELDYEREAKHAALYGAVLRDIDSVRVPQVHTDLSTKRLLSLGWLDGEKILNFAQSPIETRNRLAQAMFKAWWHPFSRAAVIHGDPHLGNYTVFSEGGEGLENRRASTCSITAACASSIRASSAAWSISIAACWRTTATGSSMPTRSGASRSSTARPWTSSTSGPASSTARFWRTAPAPSPTASNPAPTDGARPSRCIRR